MAVTERSPLLGADPSRTGRRIRILVSGLALVLLLAGIVTCIAIIARYLRGSSVAPMVMADEFDLIVIGGGPAGSVVSRLLSDDPWRRVLLIEAGNASQTQVGGKNAVPSTLNFKGLTPFDIPYYWTNVANTPSLHWPYPDVNIAKALGGCGIHNAMLYVRPLPSDLERWQMEKWTWEKTLKIYMDIEDFDGPSSSYHSTRGFLRTSPAALDSPLSSEFIEACEGIGIQRTADFNAPDGRVGAGYYHFNTRDGVRESAVKAFLDPVVDTDTGISSRKNFQLLTDTTVTKITIDDMNVTSGVEVRYGNGTRQLIRLAEHGQVILTAGAINTPKVLMLSGIGNRELLQKNNLPVKKHLPRVGMNLQDHPVVGMVFECVIYRKIDLDAELKRYLKATRTPDHTNASSFGLFGSPGISAGAFLIPPGSTLPEIQLTLFPRKSEPHMSNTRDLNHAKQVIVTIALLHPLARNRVVLVHDDEDSVDDSTIDDYLIPRVTSEVPEHEAEHLREGDLWKMTWAVGVVRQITAAMAEKGQIGAEISPGIDVTSTKDLNKWVLNSVFRNTHWVGSASMANSEDEGVVDNHLRVFGVKNLRVADASVIPLIPNGNVHSSVVMVANRAVQIYREDEQEERHIRAKHDK